MGAVDDDEGLVPEDLEAPGHPHRGEPLLHDVARERRLEEALDRGEGDGGVVALVVAVEREEHVGVHGQGRLEGEQPAAEAELVLGAVEVELAPPHDARPSARNRAARSGSVSPRTSVEPGFTMPAFSRATSASVGPAYSVWSSPTLVTTATWPSPTFVASHRPSSPTSTTATSTAASANVRKAAAVRISKYDGRTPASTSRSAVARTSSANVSSSMGSASSGDALVHPLEVRAGVGADAEALGHQQAA